MRNSARQATVKERTCRRRLDVVSGPNARRQQRDVLDLGRNGGKERLLAPRDLDPHSHANRPARFCVAVHVGVGDPRAPAVREERGCDVGLGCELVERADQLEEEVVRRSQSVCCGEVLRCADYVVGLGVLQMGQVLTLSICEARTAFSTRSSTRRLLSGEKSGAPVGLRMLIISHISRGNQYRSRKWPRANGSQGRGP